MFGSDDLPIPPSCLITVWAKLTQDTEEHLSYPVSLIGVNCDAEAIYIDRFLEKGTTGILCNLSYINIIYTGTNTATINPDSNTGNIYFISIIIIIGCYTMISHTSQCVEFFHDVPAITMVTFDVLG